MNAAAIESAAKQTRELQLALKWMREYGSNALDLKGDDGGARFVITPAYAGACPGAKEAIKQLEAVARHFGIAILEHAIRDAENTIEIHRQTIIREIGEPQK